MILGGTYIGIVAIVTAMHTVSKWFELIRQLREAIIRGCIAVYTIDPAARQWV